MIRIIKGNVERIVDEQELDRYLKEGFESLEKDRKVEAPASFESLKIADLRLLAKERGIKGYSSLTKKELLAVLE